MSDDDLDALFDEFDDDDVPLTVQQGKDTHLNSSVAKEEVASPADVSANEEKLRSELEEMKRKMKMMEEMLQKQSMTTPVKSEPSTSSFKNNSVKSTPVTVSQKKTSPKTTLKKPSLSDAFTSFNSQKSNINQSQSVSNVKQTPTKSNIVGVKSRTLKNTELYRIKKSLHILHYIQHMHMYYIHIISQNLGDKSNKINFVQLFCRSVQFYGKVLGDKVIIL